MAIAPPATHDVDIVVVAARHATPLDALALLRYLQSVSPEVVVMIGTAWVQHFTNVDSFKNALLADRLEQLSKCGARLYLVDPQRRRNTHIALPRGRKIEVRSELQLRVDGNWVLFGSHDYLLPPFERLRTWTRAWFGGARRQPTVDPYTAFAKTAFALADERHVQTIVLDLPQPLLQRMDRPGGAQMTLASPGAWAEEHQLLEHRFGQWQIADADRLSVEELQVA